jgi:hypothetical protein
MEKHITEKTFEEAEYWYKNGLISEEQWDTYRLIWRNSAPHFSSLAEEFEVIDNKNEK